MLSFGIASILTVLLGECFCDVGQTSGERFLGAYDPGPLLLTPLLEAGKIQEAQDASRVYLQDYPSFISYSGFFTVDEQFNSNLFFWFFPAANGNKSVPVLLWLQGGPGSSVFLGIFLENGPFSIGQDLRLKPRKYSWTSSCSVLYIESPVGTGYSFTDPGGQSTNASQVGNNLYCSLVQFFTLFPHFQSNDLFVTGESYGSKFITAVCYTIHERNPTATLKINLKGLSVGNGLMDPESMLNYGDYLYQIGLLDLYGKNVFNKKEIEIVQYIHKKQWRKALELYDMLIRSKEPNTTIFENLTGFSFRFNYLYKDDYTVRQRSDIEQYLSSAEMRKTLHAGNSNSSFQVNDIDIFNSFPDDIIQSVKPWFEVLVENYRVLLYNGQLDIRSPYPLTEAFLDTISWSGAREFKKASRKLWYVGTELAGYSKTTGNLTFLLVRNAGHFVTVDQPKWALNLISKFVGYECF